MFNDKQIKLLHNELDSTRIKNRSKGNISLSYLESFDIIDTANKIFGYGNWSYSVTDLTQVSQETNQNQNIVICYKAILSITIHNIEHTNTIKREDVGFGTGIAKSLADAHESSAKEAVTDSLKRALRSFGNQFGNSLYDKSKNHQNNQNPTQNYNQQSHQTVQKQQPQYQSQNNHQDYSQLYNIGLQVIDQGSNLIILGDNIFAKKDTIKAYGFIWDTNMKLWYKPKEEVA